MIGRDARSTSGLRDDEEVLLPELGREVADDLQAALEGRWVEELTVPQVALLEGEGHGSTDINCDLARHDNLRPTG